MRYRLINLATVFAAVTTQAAHSQGPSCEVAKLPATPADHEQWGFGVANTSDCAFIGVPGDRVALVRGAARLYRRSGMRWNYEITFRPSDISESIGFGGAVALSGSGQLAVVGAPADIIPDVIDGSVYVYERFADNWVQSAKLIANQPDQDPFMYDFFGKSVTVDGTTILVGAWNDTSAYVFTRQLDGSWAQSARLTPDDDGWYFGYSVAMHDDVIVIGAPSDFTQGQWAGAAFVFEPDDAGVWHQTARLLPIPGNLQHFGYSVAVHGNIIVIGTPEDDTQAPLAGAAYVFERQSEGGWIETQRLFAPDAENSDFFGKSVAIDGETILVGAENYAGDFYGFGAAFVFQRNVGAEWVLSSTLMAHDPHDGSEFGRVVALRGGTAVVGAPYQDEGGIEDAGAAYVFAVGPDADANGVADPCDCLWSGDLDLDGVVALSDLATLLSSFMLDERGDLNGDGRTDLEDIAELLSNWGRTCP